MPPRKKLTTQEESSEEDSSEGDSEDQEAGQGTDNNCELESVYGKVVLPWTFWYASFRTSMFPKPLNVQVQQNGKLLPGRHKVVVTHALKVSGLWGLSMKHYYGWLVRKIYAPACFPPTVKRGVQIRFTFLREGCRIFESGTRTVRLGRHT